MEHDWNLIKLEFDWNAMIKMDAKSRMKEIMRRPAIFVGSARLDYIKEFAEGFDICERFCNSGETRHWDIDYELQYWMLSRHSAIIRGCASLNAWSLFYRYFGTGQFALEEFSRYIYCDDLFLPEEIEDKQRNNVSVAVYKLRGKYTDDYFDLLKRHIYNIVMRLIKSTGSRFDETRVYIRRVYYFTSVRLLYHATQGWYGDTAILKNPSNYNDLIELHALLECLSDAELIQLSVPMNKTYFHCQFDEVAADKNILDVGHSLRDADALVYQYEKWKRERRFISL